MLKWAGQKIEQLKTYFQGGVRIKKTLQIGEETSDVDGLIEISLDQTGQVPTITLLSNIEEQSASSKLIFNKDSLTLVDGELIAEILSNAQGAGNNELTYGGIRSFVAKAAESESAGKLVFSVLGTGDAGTDLRNVLILQGRENANGVADATIGLGTSSITTISGSLTMGSTSFVDSNGRIQVATQGTINHDSLANFVTAEHVAWANASAGTIHSTNVPTLNQNTTGTAATVTGAAQTNITSLGTLTNLQVDDVNINGSTITVEGDLSLNATGDVNIQAAGNDVNVDTDFFRISSASTNHPRLYISATEDATGSGILVFEKDRNAAAADDDRIGQIAFVGEDASQNAEQYATITCIAAETAHGDEAGTVTINVVNDGTERNGITMTGDKGTAQEVDVQIAHGAASVTTIAGTLTMGSTAALTNAGLVAVANQSSITGLGTISSGVWNGDVIASAYLDSDTAHLSGTQTFTGLKTFNQAINKKALHFIYTSNKFTTDTSTETYFSLSDAERDSATGSEDGSGIMCIVPCTGILKQFTINSSTNLSNRSWEFRVYRVPSGADADSGGEVLMATVAANAGPAAHTNKKISFVTGVTDTNVISYETGFDAETMFTGGDRALLSLESSADASGSPKINAVLAFELDESTIYGF